MTIERHRGIEPPRRPGRLAAFAAALAAAMLLLGTAPAAAEPVFRTGQVGGSESNPQNASAGWLVSTRADAMFDDAGTNPRFTEAVFSTTEYYDESRSRIRHNGASLFVKVKSTEELRALPAPPSNPFTVEVDVTMTNDEGETASGTIFFRTYWDSG